MYRVIVIFLTFTVAYWLGYLICNSMYDKRPICFIKFTDSQNENSEMKYFWGYSEVPYALAEDSNIFGICSGQHPMYFFISQNKLFEYAHGREITVIFNIGKYSKTNNDLYMDKLLRTGTMFEITEINCEN